MQCVVVFKTQVSFFDSHKLNPIKIIAVYKKSLIRFNLNEGFEACDPSYKEYVAFLESASSVSSQLCWTPDIRPFFSLFAWAAAECQQGLPRPARPLLLQGIQQNVFPRNAAKTLTLWEWERMISHSDQILF